jgi:hypothetical protein
MSDIEEQIREEANVIITTMKQDFNDLVSNTDTLLDYYRSSLINNENTIELYNKYLQNNKDLEKKVRNSHSDILTNDRKTYYETEAHDKLDSWFKILRWTYYILVFLLIVSLFFTSMPLAWWNKLIIIILVLLYPIIIKYLIDFIYDKYSNIKNELPKNVYNNL